MLWLLRRIKVIICVIYMLIRLFMSNCGEMADASMM